MYSFPSPSLRSRSHLFKQFICIGKFLVIVLICFASLGIAFCCLTQDSCVVCDDISQSIHLTEQIPKHQNASVLAKKIWLEAVSSLAGELSHAYLIEPSANLKFGVSAQLTGHIGHCGLPNMISCRRVPATFLRGYTHCYTRVGHI